MLSLLVMFSVTMLSPSSVSPKQEPTQVIAHVGRDVDSRRDAAMRRLASEPSEVRDLYDTLAFQKKRERMQIFETLQSSVKSSVWTHQFLVALAQHPEFNEEQRAVLYDAIELFSPELFEIPYPSPGWSSLVDQPLQKLAQRAKAAFGFALARQLFAQLGPGAPNLAARDRSQSSGDVRGASPGTKTLRPAPEDLPQCECSTTSDYCSWELGSDWACVGGGCYWGLNWGCGTGELYPCNGLCQLQYGGG